MSKKFFGKTQGLKNQGGFSMVELALVLVAAALILVGVFSKFSGNSSAASAQELSGDLITLVGKVKSNYANQYANATNANLNTGGFFRDLNSLNNNAGTVVTNLGGGTLTVSGGTVNSANDSVSYVITQVPDDGCLPLVSTLAKQATKLTVGSNIVKAPGTPVNPSNIICSGDNNTISFWVI